ncbi:NAD(P)/FAD-dependent oxidoreductase [Kineococcus siccus]|uniref:NAD(P)/FAD-dependent oxidoreductase n=1 Tax=Kineococcus siccus TaxID=2696567 RepID=UPI0030B818E2
MTDVRRIVVVGASLAGLGAVRALRAEGFDGEVVVVGDEVHRPYDRPPLSKQLLLGTWTTGQLALETADEGLDARWLLGVPAVGLDLATRTLTLADGTELTADGFVVATGARARRLPGADATAGVHVLRTLDDAAALGGELRAGRRLVVVGGGFLGSEVAAAARSRDVEVTVLERGARPFVRQFGEEVGALVGALHARGGTTLRGGVAVTGFTSTPDADGGPRVTGVELAGGEVVPADVVLVAVGAHPNVEWLAGSGLELLDGVRTDDRGATSSPHVVAVGDCATVVDPAGGAVRHEHWTTASERPAVAVRTLLSGGTAEDRFTGVPYVWSDLYGERLQFAGHREDGDAPVFVEGGPGEDRFVVVWEREGVPTAVLGLSSSRTFTKWRRQLLKQTTAA